MPYALMPPRFSYYADAACLFRCYFATSWLILRRCHCHKTLHYTLLPRRERHDYAAAADATCYDAMLRYFAISPMMPRRHAAAPLRSIQSRLSRAIRHLRHTAAGYADAAAACHFGDAATRAIR